MFKLLSKGVIGLITLALWAWVIAVSGCVTIPQTTETTLPDTNVPIGGDTAKLIVLDVYGLDRAQAIHWRTTGFVCGAGHGWCRDGSMPTTGNCDASTICVDGGYTPDDGFATVALLPGEKLYQTALAHEIGHYLSFQLYGDYDANHTGPVFAKNGPVEQAQIAIEQAGL